MTQVNMSARTLRSARAFMDEFFIEAIQLRGDEDGDFKGVRGLGFVSEEEKLCVDKKSYELGEILVNQAGIFLEPTVLVQHRMTKVRGFISEVIEPVKLVIAQTYYDGDNLSHRRFKILTD